MKTKTYAEIINEKLKQGFNLSAKCIVKYTGCNNPFEVIRKLRAKYGYDYIKTKTEINKLSGKEFIIYYI